MSNTMEARVISITGEEVYRLNGNTRRGDILDATFNWEKIGGLREFKLTLSRENSVILFSGMRWEFYFKDDVFLDLKKIFTGYTEIIPTSEDNQPTVILNGKGYYWKLKEQLLNQSFTSQSISTIINTLDYSDTDLDVTAFDLDIPTINVTVNFKDKTYIQVIDTLLKITNENYKTTQYVWGVNENRGLYFKPLPAVDPDVGKNFFEGYHFQNPSVEISDKIVNSLDVFRATFADAKQTEYVATYNNSDSQGQYGVRKSKITISDFLDTASIVKLADSILEEQSEPKKIISINNFYVKDAEITTGNLIFEESGGVSNWVFQTTAVDTFNAVYRESVLSSVDFDRILPLNYYGINTKPQEKSVLINECDSLNGWIQNLIDSTVVVNDDTVLTGRKVFKWTRDANKPTGGYIEYTLPFLIQNPLEVCFAIYFLDNPANVTFTFISNEGNSISVSTQASNPDIINTWLQFCTKTPDTYIDTVLQVEPTAGNPENLQVGVTPENLNVNYWENEDGQVFNDLIRNIEKIQISLDQGTITPDTIYIDRINASNFAWTYSRLALEKAVYQVKRNFILGQLEFGDKKDTLTDQIKDKVGKGDLAFDMYAKQ